LSFCLAFIRFFEDMRLFKLQDTQSNISTRKELLLDDEDEVQIAIYVHYNEPSLAAFQRTNSIRHQNIQ